MKHQPHGPGRSLRRLIWIEPYHKGDPTFKVLMRQVKIEDPK